MAQDYRITSGTSADPIPATIYPATDGQNWVLLVGGSGDTRAMFDGFAQQLQQQTGSHIVTFAFRGVESGLPQPLRQQATDLTEVLDYLVAQVKVPRITVVCTSAGAFSVSLALASGRYNGFVDHAIFMDPADYTLDGAAQINPYTLSGLQMYSMPSESAATALGRITDSKLIVDVLFFTIRNFGRNGYVTPSLRGTDDPQLYTRLNKTMVKSFYNNPPAANRGRFIELHNVPHAFVRDGNIACNIQSIVNAVTGLLGPRS